MSSQVTTTNWYRDQLKLEVESRWLSTRVFAILTAICTAAALLCSFWEALSNLITLCIVLGSGFLSVTAYAGFTYWSLKQRLHSNESLVKEQA